MTEIEALVNQFPDRFLWGAATAAYQIEGATAIDGRKPSVWDTFSGTPGRVLNGDTGEPACDHYHRYRDDIKLLADLGMKHYRFSISWCRVVPDGRGAVNEAGLDFYSRLVECLLEYGITPHATLFHWDSPQALEDLYGSWRSREIAKDFADYVAVTVQRLGDRITNWITINEIPCFTHMGYGVRQVPPHAPGTIVQTPREVWQTSHHALLAHGMACQAIRSASPVPCSVSLVDNFAVSVPLMETPEHVSAAKAAFPFCGQNGGILYPALTGAYHPEFLQQLGENAPEIRSGDLEIIHQPIDRLGFNIYSGVYVRSIDHDPGYEILPVPPTYPRMHMPWLQVVPDSLYWGVRHISETLNLPDLPILITENGCAADDQLQAGEVLDSDRIFYLRQYLKAAQRATQEGYPLQGYFVWSLMDNFEWAWGYDRRFGIVYVDYPTQQRIPKASARYYSECVRQNRVV
ncbi:GH1 family beta-glucosidase [Leptolyngbya ohadii]|uniref:GH1 family beta-glucosidase n=1 Tax=Leptolyngbya ohadii TaxID=1962290 RepID=UPI001CED069E|nr:GH1 family beta-glucosidase [Leptolyngbya ohadii]